ncbi:MAG: PEGA domain-containing protein [Myxococcales bacterium]|nr:PEGA domain-containing protein [Myxococcales bacterium]
MRHLVPSLGVLVFLCVSMSHAAHAATVYTTRTNIDTTPSGAEVYLVDGGSEKLLGISPLAKYKLPRGIVQLLFKKEGYDDLKETVEIGRTTQSYVFKLTKSIVPATLDFTGGNEVMGATVTVDGKVIGTVPTKTQVMPGRHQCVVQKEGYERWERWVDAVEKQTVTFDVVLVKLAATPGEALVTSNPSGGEVRVNGAPKGKTPMVVEGLTPGQYLVEVSLAGYVGFSQNVVVESGKRTVIDAQLVAQKGDLGEVKVITTTPGLMVYLDGESLGAAPVTKSDVKPGVHILEGKSADGGSTSQNVEVKAGETVVVRLDTNAPAADKARVRVFSSVPGAQVDIDGVKKGPSPFVADGLDPGTHFVTVTANGFSTWTQTVTLKAGDNEVIAELGQSGRVDIRVKSGQEADIFVNGKAIGRTPYTGELPVGTHNVLLQRGDGKTEEFRIAVGPDRIVKISAAFGQADPNAVPDNTRPMSWSARAMPAGTGAVDVWAGWPYLLNFSAGGGVGSNIDLGVSARFAFNVINELSATLQWTFVHTRTVAASVEGGIGAGLGTEERNSFFFHAMAKGSVMIADKAAITARVGLLAYTDRVGPEATVPDRDGGARMTLGFSVEAKLTDDLNGFLYFDGDPFNDNRHLYDVSYLSDPKMYGGIGVAWIF